MLCIYHTGESSLAVKIEADGSDHTENPHDDKTTPCLSFSDSSSLQQQVHNNTANVVNSIIHSTEKPYQCYVCDNVFNHSGHLKVHMRSHNAEKPYKCSACSKSFICSNDLQAHKRRMHNNTADGLKQDGKAFVNSIIHNEEKLYQCHVCDKVFSRSGHLKVHTRVHILEERYNCSLCTESFSLSSMLQIHKRYVHSNATDELKHDKNVKFERASGGWSPEDQEENLVVVKLEPDDVCCVWYFVLY